MPLESTQSNSQQVTPESLLACANKGFKADILPFYADYGLTKEQFEAWAKKLLADLDTIPEDNWKNFIKTGTGGRLFVAALLADLDKTPRDRRADFINKIREDALFVAALLADLDTILENNWEDFSNKNREDSLFLPHLDTIPEYNSKHFIQNIREDALFVAALLADLDVIPEYKWKDVIKKRTGGSLFIFGFQVKCSPEFNNSPLPPVGAGKKILEGLIASMLRLVILQSKTNHPHFVALTAGLNIQDIMTLLSQQVICLVKFCNVPELAYRVLGNIEIYRAQLYESLEEIGHSFGRSKGNAAGVPSEVSKESFTSYDHAPNIDTVRLLTTCQKHISLALRLLTDPAETYSKTLQEHLDKGMEVEAIIPIIWANIFKFIKTGDEKELYRTLDDQLSRPWSVNTPSQFPSHCPTM
jgi:hypothetical protein